MYFNYTLFKLYVYANIFFIAQVWFWGRGQLVFWGASKLYCYHTATYYSANFDRVVDLIKTDLYFKTRHFILFYSL